MSRYARTRSSSSPRVVSEFSSLRQRMAQVQDQVVDDPLRPRRVAPHQVLGAAERVVEEVRLDLRVQQLQLRDREFLFGLRFLGRCLLVAAHLGDAARDRAADRLRVLEVRAVVHGEPVAPRAALGLADEVHGARLGMRRDGREDLVPLRAEPPDHALQERHRAAVGIDATHLRADLQAVARALHVLDVGQLADRRVEDGERPTGVHRHLDLPALAVGERAGVGAAVDEPDAADVGHGGRDHEDHQEHPGEEDAALAAARERRPEHEREDQHEGPCEHQAEVEEEARSHGRGGSGGNGRSIAIPRTSTKRSPTKWGCERRSGVRGSPGRDGGPLPGSTPRWPAVLGVSGHRQIGAGPQRAWSGRCIAPHPCPLPARRGEGEGHRMRRRRRAAQCGPAGQPRSAAYMPGASARAPVSATPGPDAGVCVAAGRTWRLSGDSASVPRRSGGRAMRSTRRFAREVGSGPTRAASAAATSSCAGAPPCARGRRSGSAASRECRVPC